MKKGLVILGSDHAGFATKERLKKEFDREGIEYDDLGAYKLNPKDDYPDIAFKVAEKVAKTKGRGILLCGTGAGMIIAANKVKGIRAVEAYDTFTAKLAREHNDSNILSLSGWHIPFSKIKQIVDVWLNTKYSGNERHKRRLKKISNYEEG
jgi:ribose 5-phosphate isomerase B